MPQIHPGINRSRSGYETCHISLNVQLAVKTERLSLFAMNQPPVAVKNRETASFCVETASRSGPGEKCSSLPYCLREPTKKKQKTKY